MREGVAVGEIADDMIDGSACHWCGVYFEQTYGYPVVCRDCAKEHGAKMVQKAGLQVAEE